MVDTVQAIAAGVREQLERDGVDLAEHPSLAWRYVRQQLRRHGELALSGQAPVIQDEAAVLAETLASLTGFGALQPYLDDPAVEEIWINAPDRIFIARDGLTEQLPLRLDETGVRELIERMLHASGRRVDRSSPFVDASLADGSRLHVVLPDITRAHASVNIRKFARDVRSLGRLVELGSLPEHAAELLRAAVRQGETVLVSGATQSGKTTMLNALLDAAPEVERVITVEETFELAPPGIDAVSMQCRQPSLEGTGEISLRRLVKEALRMRPERIVVGEVREAESLDLLLAINSGVPGMCSLHANSALDALRKLCTLPLLAGSNIDTSFTVPTVTHCIDLIVHCERLADGRRRVREISRPQPAAQMGELDTEVLYEARVA